MEKPLSTPPQQGKVNSYFQTESSFWNDVYHLPSAQTDFIRDRQDAVLKWVDDLALSPGCRVLEIGCGTGHLALALAQRGFRVQAIDSVPAMIELAKGHAAKAGVGEDLLTLAVGDAYALAFGDSSFDLVIAVGVLAWLDYPERAVQEMARVAKPAGPVILTTANKAGLARFLDPLESPLLQPLKLAIKSVLVNRGLRPKTPQMFFHSQGHIDRMLGRFDLVKVKGTTCGFGFSFFRRPVLPEPLGSKVNRRLQQLADGDFPGLRSLGTSYIVMARRSAPSSTTDKEDGA